MPETKEYIMGGSIYMKFTMTKLICTAKDQDRSAFEEETKVGYWGAGNSLC